MARLTQAGAVLLALFAAALLWGVAVEPRLLLADETIEVRLPNLPADWDGQRVVLLADMQTGMWLDNSAMVRHAVHEAIELKPALALIAGDFVYKADTADVRRAVALMRPLAAAGIPTVAVLGNHDYRMNWEDAVPDEDLAARLRTALAAAGIRVLENERVQVPAPRGGDPLTVVGVGSSWAGHSDPRGAMRGIPADAARLLLMHNPQSFTDLSAGSAPIAFAGHTHGGQVRLPGMPRWSWLHIVRSNEVATDGWIEAGFGARGNRLYVNRGIGFSTFPIRLNCPPELTTIVLRQTGGASHSPSRRAGS